MCPITMAVIAAGAVVAGTGISVYSQQQQGKFQKDMMNYQADQERARAEIAKKNAEIQAGRLDVQRRQATASGMAAFAANGMLLDTDPESAPNMWEQDMAAETAWQKEELRAQAMYEAWGHTSNASALVASGSAARRGAQLGMLGTVLSGVGSAITAAGPAISGGGSGGSGGKGGSGGSGGSGGGSGGSGGGA